MSKNFTLALSMPFLLMLGSGPLMAQKALTFDATNQQHVTAPTALLPTFATGGQATLEFWVYVPVAQPDTTIFISQGGSGTDTLAIGYTDGGNTNSLTISNVWPSPNATLPIGRWTHIALVADYDNFEAWLYVNGVLVDSSTGYVLNDGSAPFQLGTNVDGTKFFSGNLDEVRIWSVARTADQIKAGMYGVDPSTSGLIYYYKMDETSGLVAHNTATYGPNVGVDLALQNMSSTNSWVTGPAIGNANGLTFDNTNGTQVVIPTNSAYDFNHGTIEFDVQPGSLQGRSAVIANRSATDVRWSVHMTNTFGVNQIGIYNGIGAGYDSVLLGTPLTGSTWYHISLVTAAAASGDTTAVYVDGNYKGNFARGYNTATTGDNLTIGGNGADLSENFVGGIDEVRLWNAPLTPAQVASYAGVTLTGTEPNLAGYWNFNQGIPDGDNAGLKMVVDQAPLTNNATLSNSFALSAGSASNFTSHPISTLPVAFGQFTATRQGTSAQLKWQTYVESNTKDFIVLRSGNGVNFTDIGTVAASGNSNTIKTYYFTDDTPLEGTNYYRIQERDLDLKSTYSGVKVLAFTRSGDLIWYTTGAKSVEIRLQRGSTEQYSISDVAGHTIRTGRLVDGITSLSGVPGGIYFVTVLNGIGDKQTTKVIIP
jgi:hypothetical protein